MHGYLRIGRIALLVVALALLAVLLARAGWTTGLWDGPL
jgi:hypothetical protein